MEAFIGSLRVDLRLMGKSRATYLLLFAICLISVWAYASAYNSIIRVGGFIPTGNSSPDSLQSLWTLHPRVGPNYILQVLFACGGLIGPIWGASLAGREFAWRTAKVRSGHNGWKQTIVSKSILIILVALACPLIGWLGGIVGSRIAWTAAIHQVPAAVSAIPPALPVSLINQALIVSLCFSFYGLVGMGLAIVLRSGIAGAIGGLALPFLEGLTHAWWLPSNVLARLLAKNFIFLVGGVFGPAPLTPAPSSADEIIWPLMFGWWILIITITIIVARRPTN